MRGRKGMKFSTTFLRKSRMAALDAYDCSIKRYTPVTILGYAAALLLSLYLNWNIASRSAIGISNKQVTAVPCSYSIIVVLIRS